MTDFLIGYFPSVVPFVISLIFLFGSILVEKETKNTEEYPWLCIAMVFLAFLCFLFLTPNLFFLIDEYDVLLNLFGVVIFVFLNISTITSKKIIKERLFGISFYFLVIMLCSFFDLNTKVDNEKKVNFYKNFKEDLKKYPKTLRYLKAFNLDELKNYEMNLLDNSLRNEKDDIDLQDKLIKEKKFEQEKLEEKNTNDAYIKKFEENIKNE